VVLLNAAHVPERSLPWFEWKEDECCGTFEATSRRRVAIVEFATSDGCWRSLPSESLPTSGGGPLQPDDDQGTTFLTMYLGAKRWAAIWLRPLFEPTLAGHFAFQVVADKVTHVSAPFTIAPNRRWPDRVPEEHRAAALATRTCSQLAH